MVFVPLGIVVRRKVFSFPVVSAISEFNMVAAYGMIETFLDVESDLRPCGGKLHISLVKLMEIGREDVPHRLCPVSINWLTVGGLDKLACDVFALCESR